MLGGLGLVVGLILLFNSGWFHGAAVAGVLMIALDVIPWLIVILIFVIAAASGQSARVTIRKRYNRRRYT